MQLYKCCCSCVFLDNLNLDSSLIMNPSDLPLLSRWPFTSCGLYRSDGQNYETKTQVVINWIYPLSQMMLTTHMRVNTVVLNIVLCHAGFLFNGRLVGTVKNKLDHLKFSFTAINVFTARHFNFTISSFPRWLLLCRNVQEKLKCLREISCSEESVLRFILPEFL